MTMIYLRVVTAMIVAGALRLLLSAWLPADHLPLEVHGVAAYLAVIGSVYGIIVAFALFVVWEQFNHVQIGLTKEAAALEDVWRVAEFLSERDSAARIRVALKRYLGATTADEPTRLAAATMSELARAEFAGLTHAIRGVAVATEKDSVVYNELLRALARVMAARDERLTVSAARIPGTLWSLVVFASVVLFGGFLALGIHSLVLSMLLVGAAAGMFVFLLSVLRDMDNPFVGAWTVSYAPMAAVATRVA
jgi:hypothetical protein